MLKMKFVQFIVSGKQIQINKVFINATLQKSKFHVNMYSKINWWVFNVNLDFKFHFLIASNKNLWE